MKRLILIDSHAIIHRAYHALPPLTSPSGEPTNAVYGFTTILLRILRELKPDFIAACFDLPGPTFRHVAYERYKAQRPETPSDLSLQFPKVKEVLDVFGIPVFEKEGFEADDVIGTITDKLSSQKNLEIVIVTGDMDALQLVRPRVSVYTMKKGISETVIYDEKAVKERYGFKPSQLTDFKGLKGDPSDNIPGVKGIGEKTAGELIKEFGSVEGVYKALKKGTKKISAAVGAKLREGEEDAKFSKELATIDTRVPIKFSLPDLTWNGWDENKVRSLFQKLGFYSILKRLDEKGETRPKVSQAALLQVGGGGRRAPRSIKSGEEFRNFWQKYKDRQAALFVYENNLYIFPRGADSVYELRAHVLKEKNAQEFLETSGFLVHEGKSVMKFLRNVGFELGPVKFDLMLAAYVANNYPRDFSYLAIAARELGRMVSTDPREEFLHFFEVKESLEAKLNEGRLREVLEKIEMPVLRILADMEERGVRVDAGFIRSLASTADKKLSGLTGEIYKHSGEPFNINSPQQLAAVLFDKLRIGTRGLRKTEKEGRISTGASELEKLKASHPIVSLILEYRELAKLKSTYIDVLPTLVDPKTSRLHTTFNQTGTATGRLSSSDPNLQNIPVISELGREIRKAFVAEDGFLLASFDYSQIELRVAAHMADDKKMIEAFQKGLDIHKMTAAEIFNVPIEKVTPEQRRAAKTLNFGILYGMGSQALAESTGMSKEEARKFIDEYFRDFSGIKDYIERTKRFAEENGYVETIFGRRRYIPEISSPNWQLKREAERMATNMPVQGSATGDIIKLAMIKVDEWIRSRGRIPIRRDSTSEQSSEDVRLLLQVHDELLFEIKKELVKKVAPKIKEIMESAAKLKVPLVVDVKVGYNWGEEREVL